MSENNEYNDSLKNNHHPEQKPGKIIPFNEHGESDFHKEKEKLLDDFLDDLFYKEYDEQPSEQKNPGEMSIEDYPEMTISEKTEKKINELQKIALKIEQKKASLTDVKFDQQKYKIDYINQLNTSQLLATTTLNGPLLVIAGAGSGKTRVIVYRVSYMIENNISPENILLLTFTRKAAAEMTSRVEQLLHSSKPTHIMGGTFHSFASLMLRKYAGMLNIPQKFTIIDTADAEDIIDIIRSQLKYDKSNKKFPKKKRIHTIISAARNKNTTIKQIVESYYQEVISYIKDIELIFHGFMRYKKITNTFDFDDLMETLRDNLRDNINFRKKLQAIFKYVMVDEFQDTNAVQKEIIDYIAEQHKNIMVVGDDSQSIYAFRGANYENILRFPETYPDCNVVKIEQNYRSTQSILDFTNNIIEHAKIGYKKKLHSNITHQPGFPIVKRFYDQQEEAAFIVDKILALREQDIALEHMAVLNRADWHNRYIQTELNKRDIPYVVVGGFRFHERAHVKDLMAYLKVIYNPSDAIAWNRILKLMPGIGNVTASSIIKHIGEQDMHKAFTAHTNKNYYPGLKKLEHTLLKASDMQKSIPEKLETIKTYYAPILESKDIDYKIRLNDIDILINLSKRYRSIEAFLSDFALEPPSKSLAGKPVPIDEEPEDKPLVVSTIHSAKGLEWRAVFIPHALEGLLPSNKACNIEEMEEERRLFYVATSRAKEYLFITYPSYVASYNANFSYPSRFIAEIDHNKYKYEDF